MDSKEMTDIIYDTLMQNKQHKQLNPDEVENPLVERTLGRITFAYEGVVVYVNIFCMGK